MASGRGNGSSKSEMEEKEKDEGATATALAVGAAAGVAAVAAWGLSRWFGVGSSEPEHKEKMMKAPGRDYEMPRKPFEDDPSTYFRNLRAKK